MPQGSEREALPLINMNPPAITFRGKPETIHFGEVARKRVKVPEITRSHCDMNAFRCSRRFGSYANSDLFPAMLKRELTKIGVKPYLYLDELHPVGVEIDASGFLWSVTITLPDNS